MNQPLTIVLVGFAIIGMVTVIMVIVECFRKHKNIKYYKRDVELARQIENFACTFEKQHVRNVMFLIGYSIEKFGRVLPDFIIHHTFSHETDLTKLTELQLNEILI